VDSATGLTTTTIYETESIDYLATVGLAAPARTVTTWTTNDAGGTITLTDPINNLTATYSPSGVGNFEVTINDNVGCSSTAYVTVNPCPPITINPTDPTINLISGATTMFNAVGGTPPYIWSLSGLAVVGPPMYSIDPNTGEFTALAEGTVTVVATDSKGCQATTLVTVTCPAITVEPANQVVLLSPPVPSIVYSANFGSPPYTYTNDNFMVAWIDPLSGQIFIFGAGTTTITAWDSMGCSGSTTLEVQCVPMSIAPADTAPDIGYETLYTVSGGVPPYWWWNSNWAIAWYWTDNDKLHYNPFAAGSDTITVWDSMGCSVTLDVTPECASMSWAQTSVNYPSNYLIGEWDYFTVFGPHDPFIWYWFESSNPAVVSWSQVDPDNAWLIANTPGTATITAHEVFGCGTVSANVTVKCPTITITAINPSYPNYIVGNVDIFTAVNATAPLVWTSSNPAVATINAAGNFSAVGAGSTIITVTDTYGCSKSATINVAPPCADVVAVSRFNMRCDTQRLDIRATTSTQPNALPLQFVIYDGAGVQKYPAAGRQNMDWNAAQNRYNYTYSNLGNFNAWDNNYYVIVYSQQCVGSQSAHFPISRSNCP